MHAAFLPNLTTKNMRAASDGFEQSVPQSRSSPLPGELRPQKRNQRMVQLDSSIRIGHEQRPEQLRPRFMLQGHLERQLVVLVDLVRAAREHFHHAGCDLHLKPCVGDGRVDGIISIGVTACPQIIPFHKDGKLQQRLRAGWSFQKCLQCCRCHSRCFGAFVHFIRTRFCRLAATRLVVVSRKDDRLGLLPVVHQRGSFLDGSFQQLNIIMLVFIIIIVIVMIMIELSILRPRARIHPPQHRIANSIPAAFKIALLHSHAVQSFQRPVEFAKILPLMQYLQRRSSEDRVDEVNARAAAAVVHKRTD
mmetsp:Transcript_23770/g.67196  ORF Transcript_23770/g.67196 Transcript_23770/m.67196 type:complete len:306 (-) Transcript_23770:765-1682(-)